MDQSEQERCHHRGAGAKKRKATSQKGCLSSKAPLSTRHSIPYTYLDILFLFAISQQDISFSTIFSDLKNLTSKKMNSVFICWQEMIKSNQIKKRLIQYLVMSEFVFVNIAYVFHCLPLPSSTISHYSLAFLGHICLFTLDIYLLSNSSFVYILQNVIFWKQMYFGLIPQISWQKCQKLWR